MTRSLEKNALTEYELAVDEVVDAHDGDMRGALRALLILNDVLETKLMQMNARMADRQGGRSTIH